MGVKKYKSVFILRVYEIYSFEKMPVYRIEKNGNTMPGFDIFESETGIFESLAQAEKRIKKQAKVKHNDLYGFLVEEKPLGGIFLAGESLSRRRYLKDGTLWQSCDVSGVRYFEGKCCDLGNTAFHGRDLKTIPF